MSNKSRLQTNNTNLQTLIDKANALPDAGSGGGSGVEGWSGIITPQMAFPVQLTVHYTDPSMNTQTKTINSDAKTTIEVAANTIVFIRGNMCNATSGCTKLGGGSGEYAYQITSNNFILTVPL